MVTRTMSKKRIEKKSIKAFLLLIGSELLDLEREDANGKYIVEKLKERNIDICGYEIIEDDLNLIKETLQKSNKIADIVITSGGLGPTGDDLTREGLAEAFSLELILNEEWFKEIEERFKSRGRQMREIDRKMAMIPKGSRIIPNKYGTASGIYFDFEDKMLFSLPGVPSEFKTMTEDFVLKEIDQRFQLKPKEILRITFAGIGESDIQEVLDEIIEENDILKYSILPHFGITEVKIVLDNSHSKNLDEIKKPLLKNLRKNIVSLKGESIVEVINEIMRKNDYSLSVAESITGGTISRKIVAVSGVSSFYKGSITAYSNEAKIELLGVPEEEIEQFGAVSENVALSMVRGARARFLTPCAIATTGIAGPTGETKDKPLGLVYIAVSKPGKERVFKHLFPFQRKNVIEMTSNYALYYLLQILRDEI